MDGDRGYIVNLLVASGALGQQFQGFRDDFDRPDRVGLGPNWGVRRAGCGIRGGKAQGITSTTGIEYRTDLMTVDHWVETKFVPEGRFKSLVVGAWSDRHLVVGAHGGGRVEAWQSSRLWQGPTPLVLGQSYSLRVERRATSIHVFLDGVLHGAFTYGDTRAGSVGVELHPTTSFEFLTWGLL